MKSSAQVESYLKNIPFKSKEDFRVIEFLCASDYNLKISKNYAIDADS